MLEFFRGIPAKDMEKFGEFIYSPYFNKSKAIVKLFDYLKKSHPSISKEDISPRKISLVVYSERKINRDKIRKLCSEFMKLHDRFMLQKVNDQDKLRNKVVVLNYFRLNNLDKRFRKNLSELNIEFKKHVPVDYHDYETILRFKAEVIGYYYNVSPESYQKSVQDYSKFTDVFYIYAKLCVFNQVLHNLDESTKLKVKSNPAFTVITSIFEDNKKFFYDNHPEIVIYYYELMMRLNFEDKYLHQLISYYNLNKGNLNNRLRFVCILPIEGYLRSKMIFEESEESISNVKMLHKMNDELFVKTKLFMHNVIENSEGYIPSDMYIYAVHNSLKLEKIVWAKNFLKKNSGFLLPDLKDSINHYCNALIFYFEKKHDDALELLIKVSHSKVYIPSRILQLKIYFEKGEYNLAEYHISALKKFLLRSKDVSERRRRKTALFVKYYNRLLKLVNNDPQKLKDDIDELHHKLNKSEEYFYNRVWINEELGRMRG